jgi:nitroreductase
MDTILKRHSVRTYSAEPIDDAIINKIVQARISAPSAMRSKLWHFIVISHRDLMNGVVDIHSSPRMMLPVQCAILACGDVGEKIFPVYVQQNCRHKPLSGFCLPVIMSQCEIWSQARKIAQFPRRACMQTTGSVLVGFGEAVQMILKLLNANPAVGVSDSEFAESILRFFGIRGATLEFPLASTRAFCPPSRRHQSSV